MPSQILLIDPNQRRQVKQFVTLPFDLYRDCPQWVPPLLSDAYHTLSPKHSAYKDAQAAFFLALRDGRPAGRIAVMHNDRSDQISGKKEATFSFFDCIDDTETAQALFNQACDWAHLKGLSEINGPRGLTSWDGSGVLVKGFEYPAALNQPYNYPYYEALITAAGFESTGDSFTGFLPGDHELPPRVKAIAEKVKERRGLWIKSFTRLAEIKPWVPQVADVIIRSFSLNPGFVPPSQAEIEEQAKMLLSIADPRLIKLVMHGEEVVGFVFAYHDLGPALKKAKGRLFPLGWLYVLQERRKNFWVDINGIGLVKEHQRVGGDALLFSELEKSIKSFGFKQADIIMVSETNLASRTDMEALGVSWYKAHRSYHKDL